MLVDISEIRVKEELIKLGAIVSSINPDIFYWKKELSYWHTSLPHQ